MSRMSLPSRERGLKSMLILGFRFGWGVAPFAGAWIEILQISRMKANTLSLPSRERGLKFFYGEHGEQVEPSLPSRERGLKFMRLEEFTIMLESLPSRERGLKSPPNLLNDKIKISRSLRGSVD